MRRKQYTEEFKREALELATRGDVSIAQLEHDLGITSGLIHKWRERYRVDAGSGKFHPSMAQDRLFVPATMSCAHFF